MEITREVQVDFVHREHLCMASSASTALESEARAERGFTQGAYRFPSDVRESESQSYCHRRLADARFRGSDGCDEDEIALLHTFFVDEFCRHFGYIVPVMFKFCRGNAVFGSHFFDVLQLCTACYFYVCHNIKCIVNVLSENKPAQSTVRDTPETYCGPCSPDCASRRYYLFLSRYKGNDFIRNTELKNHKKREVPP